MWQDYVITAASFIFSAALIPQVYKGYKEKKGTISYATSGPTFIGLYAICYAYFTLDLFLSMAISLITGTLWFALFIQRLVYKKQESEI